jgi:hypothetical protein
MKLRRFCLLVLPLLILPCLAVSAYADILGAASSYAVLATTQVTAATNVAPAVIINGDMGAVSCTGFVAGTGCTLGFGIVNGAVPNLGNAPYLTALAASNTAYTALANTPSAFSFTGFCLGSGSGCLNNLAPGVYKTTDSVANLIGALTLAGGGNPDALWIFQTAAGFVTASGSSVIVTGTSAAAGVYFQVGSQATLGDNTAFQGNILAGTAVVFDPGAQITCGRAFTDTSAGTAVTFAGNNPAVITSLGGQNNLVSDTCTQSASGFNGGTITTPPGGGPPVVGPPIAAPEPGTFLLLGSGIAGLVGMARRKRAKAPRA